MIFKLTKTEALILSHALGNGKYEMLDGCEFESKAARLVVIKKLNELEKRLDDYCTDGRMGGRRHFRSFKDRLIWWVFGTFDQRKLPKDEPIPGEQTITITQQSWNAGMKWAKEVYAARQAAKNQIDLFESVVDESMIDETKTVDL